MIDNQRFKDIMEYLKTNKYIRNQQDFTERVGSDKATVSQIMNNRINIPNVMFANIEAAFPVISSEWLRTGDGEMLNGNANQTSHGDNSPNIAGNGNHVNGPGLIEELSAQRRLTEKAQEQLSKSQEQIDRLLSIIERMGK